MDAELWAVERPSPAARTGVGVHGSCGQNSGDQNREIRISKVNSKEWKIEERERRPANPTAACGNVDPWHERGPSVPAK